MLKSISRHVEFLLEEYLSELRRLSQNDALEGMSATCSMISSVSSGMTQSGFPGLRICCPSKSLSCILPYSISRGGCPEMVFRTPRSSADMVLRPRILLTASTSNFPSLRRSSSSQPLMPRILCSKSVTAPE